MQFFKRDASKAEKKFRDSRSDIISIAATDAAASTMTHTPAAVSIAVTPHDTPDAPSAQEELQKTEPQTADVAETSMIQETPATVAKSIRSMVAQVPMSQSVVAQAKGNIQTGESENKRMDAAASYMYGQKEDKSYIPEKKPSSSYSDTTQPRTNRAQELRNSRNRKRINEEKMMREQMMKERIIRARSEMGESSDESDHEEAEPIHARLIPKSLYHKPKINVRETVSSKFRYLFNRKPPGVTVYFKQADDKDPKKKPPFVVAAVNRCF